MKSKELGETDPWRERNFVLVLEDGEEAFAAITGFAEAQKLGGASLTAIGAFRSATLGFFDFPTKLQGNPDRPPNRSAQRDWRRRDRR